MSQEDNFAPEWDLANIAMRTGRDDGFLRDLADLAESGVPTLVGLLTNGMIVIGVLSRLEEIAGELDRIRKNYAEAAWKSRPDDKTEEEWRGAVDSWTNVNMQLVEQIREEREEVEAAEEGSWDYSVPPRGMARKALAFATRQNLTLTQVQVAAAGQVGVIRVPVMRVAMGSIAAWWPIPVDESGSARFQLFTTDDD